MNADLTQQSDIKLVITLHAWGPILWVSHIPQVHDTVSQGGRGSLYIPALRLVAACALFSWLSSLFDSVDSHEMIVVVYIYV